MAHLNHGWFVLHYVTLRAVLAAVLGFSGMILMGPRYIRWLKQQHVQQFVRDDGPQTHLVKAGTPTMGGALMLGVILLVTLILSDLNNQWVQMMLVTLIAFGLIGGVDDYQKLMGRDSQGLSARLKILFQGVAAIGLMLWLYCVAQGPVQTSIFVPFLKHALFDLSWGIVPLGLLAIVGSSNAVNLTDGLDGLAIMPIILVAAGLGVFAYASGHVYFAHYLQLPAVSGASELAVFSAALVGAGLGFLWFNAHPAEVFMGDVGSLSLGACLGMMAMIVRQEVMLIIMGGVFVAEALSVIIQVTSFKWTGQRVFRMAPLHHHFELKGLSESKVIVRFWIVTLILVLLSIMTLKLR